jgi:perosamine synthetase
LIPIAKPSLGDEELRLVEEVIRSGWVAQGPKVVEFERRFADRVGAPEAVAVSSCTAALFLSLRALGIGPGDEVVVPSLSFIASTNAIAHCGATPVFVDVDPRTYNLDPDALEGRVSSATRAVMAVHQVGLPVDLDRVQALADRHGFLVLEDAACAIGSRYRGEPIGSRPGSLACFSFHPRKLITTGEGGMITTHDRSLASRLRRLRHQGMSVSDLDRHRASRAIIEEYPEVGYNFRMSDLHAAIGLAQLEKLDSLLERRRALASRYDEALAAIDGVEVPFEPDFAGATYQSYLVRLRGVDAETRNRVIELLQARGVSTRRGLMAAHREAPYREAPGADALPHTEAATDQTLAIPLYADLSEDDQDRVIEALAGAVSSLPTSAAPKRGV